MKVEEVEGIGPAHAARLDAAGLSGERVPEWTDHCDLPCPTGVGSEYSGLLAVAGVNSPAEVAHRDPANLTAAMAKYQDEHRIVLAPPPERRWRAGLPRPRRCRRLSSTDRASIVLGEL